MILRPLDLFKCFHILLSDEKNSKNFSNISGITEKDDIHLRKGDIGILD